MPLSAGWDLQRAVYSALAGDATLVALLGGPHVYDDVPQKAAFPFVTIGRSELRDWSTGTDPGTEHQLTMHVWSRVAGRREVHEILGALADILHEATLSLTDHILVNLRQDFSEVRRDPDGETYHGIMRLRAVTEPAA